MKHKIRRQLLFSMLGMGIGVILLIFILNTAFLRNIYYREKYTAMKKAFSEISASSVSKGVDTEEFMRDFEAISIKRSISMMIIGSDGNVIISTRGENENYYLVNQFLYLILGSDENDDEDVLEASDDYILRKYHDDRLNADFLVLWGALKDGNFIMIRTGIEGISESIGIFNRFLLFGGIVAILISVIFAFLLSDRIAKPIVRLTEISRKMSNLDFSEKYDAREKGNEVDDLGQRMNMMSEALEGAINDLKDANEKLQEDLRLKEENESMRREFISNVSHELKTPISLILGYSEGLSEGICESPEDIKYYTDVIKDEAERMNRIVSELSALNRIEYGKEILSPERFDITGMIRGLIESLSLMAEQKNAVISFKETEEMFVFYDVFLMEQALTNYITNAIRYFEGEKRIKIYYEDVEGKLKINVFNTGKGIKEENKDRIWEKFFKEDPARTREVGGTGIGLSVVKAVSDAFNAGVGVENVIDGVVFYIILDKN